MMVPALLVWASLAAPGQPAAGPQKARELPPEGTWVVLVRTEGAVPAHWAQELQTAVARAAEDTDRISVVPSPQVSLDDVQLALGCAQWDHLCAGKVASMMGATASLLVDVVQEGEGGALTLTLVDVNGKSLVRRPKEELPDVGENGLLAARSSLRSLMLGVEPTVLIVETDVPGAELFLDGQKVGVTPYTARDIEPGPHKIRLSLEGRAPLTKEVDVPAGTTTRQKLVLGASAPPHHEPTVGNKDPAPLSVSPALSWSVLGAGAAVMGVAAAFYVVHVGIYLVYLRYGFDTQRTYHDRRALLPMDIANVLSLGSYGAAATVGVIGLLIAASGAGLVVASLVTGAEE